MDEATFRKQQQQIIQQIHPYKEIRLGEIQQIQGNIFTVGGMDLVVSPRVIQILTDEIGSSERQITTVRTASGETAEAKFRNYLSSAQSLVCERNAVIVADPNTRTVTDLIIPKKDFIPMEQFFDFTEFFINETDTNVEKMEWSKTGGMNVIIYLQSNNPVTQSFAPNDDFISNGMFIQWQGDQISMGNFYTRLICSNGATEQETRQLSAIHTLSAGDVSRLVDRARSEEFLSGNAAKYLQRAERAMETFTSLKEMHDVYAFIQKRIPQLPTDALSEIVPYEEYQNYFCEKGADIHGMAHRIKTDMTIWQLYNNLTAFATHTDMLDAGDLTRKDINMCATRLLNKRHDIVNYIEYAPTAALSPLHQ